MTGGARRPLARALAALVVVALAAPACLRAAGPAAPPAADAAARGTVVLLHGLYRSDRSMAVLAEALSRAGYRVVNHDYPSTRRPPDALIDGLAEEVRRCCPPAAGPLHFVTHSLGGILVRGLLARGRPANLGRVVMLAPPNRGSELVDVLGHDGLARLLLGPTGALLGTAADSLPNRLPPVDFELGVVIGDAGRGLGAWLIPGASDGTVSVERARVEGMTDFLVVDERHTYIMRDAGVADQAIHFLEHGAFRRPPG